MKIKNILVSLFLGIYVTGCTHFGNHLNSVQQKEYNFARQNNESIRLTANAMKTNILTINKEIQSTNNISSSKVENLLDQVELGDYLILDWSGRNQALLGDPPVSQSNNVSQLLKSNKVAEVKNEIQAHKENSLIKKEKKYEQSLVSYGEKYEEQRNAKIEFWTKWLSILGVGIGGIIALCVFFPPMLGGLVGIFPALAHVFGVVGKGTVSNIVSAVDGVKTRVNNAPADKTYTQQEVLQLLDEKMNDNLEAPDLKIVAHFSNQSKS